MKAFYLFIGLCMTISGFAQYHADQRWKDSVIGWDPNNKYDDLKPQLTALGRQKEASLNKMVEWMKKSYTPFGGLGEYQRFINATGFQVLFSVWDVDFKRLDAKKRFIPIGETGFPRFYMAANFLAGAWNIDFMCRADRWYFTMQPDGYSPHETESRHRLGSDPRICPLAHKYITWINEWHAVYLVPGNKLPMIRVTKGDLLKTALKDLDGVADSLIREDRERGVRGEEARRQKEVDQYRNNVRALLEKYKDRLDEPASVAHWQWNFRDLITGSWDVFTRGPNTVYYPVYKIDAGTIEKMKGAQPLWISIIFPYETPKDGNKAYTMYDAMTKHLNYDYIYNYFFDPGKNDNRPYTPVK